MNIPRSISPPRKTISLSHKSRNALIVTKRCGNNKPSTQNKFSFTSMETR